MTDYGKTAYMQIQELTKRVNALTNSLSKESEKTVVQHRNNLTITTTDNEIQYTVGCEKLAQVEIEFVATYSSATTQNVPVSLRIDDLIVSQYQESMTAGCGGVIIFKTQANIEVSNISVEFTPTADIVISSCYFSATGSLADYKSVLINCTANSTDYYGLIIGQNLDLYTGSLNSSPTQIVVSSVDKAQLVYLDGKLKLLFTDKGKLKSADIENGEMSQPTVIENSVTAFFVDNSATPRLFWAVRREIHCADITFSDATVMVNGVQTTIRQTTLSNETVLCATATATESIFFGAYNGTNYLSLSSGTKNKVYVLSGANMLPLFEESEYHAVGMYVGADITCYYFDNKKLYKTVEENNSRRVQSITYADSCLPVGDSCLIYRDGKLTIV